jgi:arabinogalactan oligomer/maltooligosaccharide transport system substrate-binding protein
MKKHFRFAPLVMGLVLVASACTSGSSPSPSAQASAPATGASAPASEAPSEAPKLSGELTLWHSYGSGGGETGALNTVLGTVRTANPDLKITVVEQPFSDIFNKWQTDVLAGGGPDLFIAPNDNLFSQSDAGALLDITDKLTGKLEGFSQVAVDGSKVGDKFYMVPESLKAVALWYDKSAIATPPASTDALLAGVKDGSIKLGLNQNAYHMFGFTGAFGGTLMDASGKCTADAAGFADAFKYFQDLKDGGAKYYTDGNALKQDFQSGKLNAVVDGPWQTADFKTALGDKLAVAKIPAGPSGGKANPFTGTDGWYINPNAKDVDLAVNFALLMVGTANEQVFTDSAGHVPAAPGVTINDPIVQGFADAAADGLARPQSSQFNNYWGPFGDAINQVLDKKADATATVATACKTMNEANGL